MEVGGAPCKTSILSLQGSLQAPMIVFAVSKNQQPQYKSEIVERSLRGHPQKGPLNLQKQPLGAGYNAPSVEESGELGKLEELGELDGAEAEGGKDERKPREPDQPPRWKRRRAVRASS